MGQPKYWKGIVQILIRATQTPYDVFISLTQLVGTIHNIYKV